MFESSNTIRGLVAVMPIPILFLIGHFGERTPGWQQKYEMPGGMLDMVEAASAWLKPFLNAMDMPYFTVDPETGLKNLTKAVQAARERSGQREPL